MVDRKGSLGNGMHSGLKAHTTNLLKTRGLSAFGARAVLNGGLTKGADAILTAGQLVAPFIPGAAVVSAAVSSSGQFGTGSGGGDKGSSEG